MAEQFLNLAKESILKNLPDKLPKRIAVAVSGGSDSMALTFLLKDFCDKNNIKLSAISIDHKLRKNSSAELVELNQILISNAIDHQIFPIENHKVPKVNIEGQLRELRYFLLTKFCKDNKIDFLFLGHHLGDVAENFIIRLFRGSGLDGLSTMSSNYQLNGINIIRPMLDFTKEDLIKYLKVKQVKWFEDETNNDEKFLRNKIRKFLSSFEDKDLISLRIKNTSDQISQIRDQFDDLLLDVAKKSLKYNPERNFFVVDKDCLKDSNQLISLKIIALVLMEISGKEYKPRREKLQSFYSRILEDNFKNINFYGSMAISINSKYLAIFTEEDKEIFLKIKPKHRTKLLDLVYQSKINFCKLKTILSKIYEGSQYPN